MQTLRLIAATLVACSRALGLSVGAALADGPREPIAERKPGHDAPAGLCRLDDADR